MESSSGDSRGWLWFVGILLIGLIVMWVAESADEIEYVNDSIEIEAWSSVGDNTFEEPVAPPMSLIELARSRYARCQDPELYCSEHTVVETYEKAVREDPDLFDEASEVFGSFLGPDTRSAVYLRVMRAYVNLIGHHPAALDNYLITFDSWLGANAQSRESRELDAWDIDQAFYSFKKAWENSGGDERLVHKAVDFERYFEFVIEHDDGFDSNLRYTKEPLEKILVSGGQDPFWCSRLAERVDHLLWIAEIRGDEVKARKWKLHMADYFATLHICEDGHPAPDPERAYELYTELGMDQDAQDAAWMVVSNTANSFVFGGDPYAPWAEIPEPCDPEVFAHLLEWYPRTGLNADEQKAELYAFAQAIEEVGYLDAALKIYEYLGDEEQSIRLRPLANEQPRPDKYVQLEHFFMRLEKAEQHLLHETP